MSSANTEVATLAELVNDHEEAKKKTSWFIEKMNTPALACNVAHNVLPKTKTQGAVAAGAVAAGVGAAVVLESAPVAALGVVGAIAYSAIANDDGEAAELAGRACRKLVDRVCFWKK